MCGPNSSHTHLDENDLQIEFLEDGTGRVRITTGRFSGPIHTTAEGAVKYIETLLGGTTTRERVANHHHHDHDHAGKGHSHGH